MLLTKRLGLLIGKRGCDYWLCGRSNTTNTSKFDFGKNISVVGVVWGPNERDHRMGQVVQEAADLFRYK